MGCCVSSTKEVVDPRTGQIKVKKTCGGAYPGNRRQQLQPYVPPASDYNKEGIAVSHFVAVGGGNALTLVRPTEDHHNATIVKPQTNSTPPQFVQVTLPDGVAPGQTIHVRAPDGRTNAIVVPEGFGPGSTFTVEFDNSGKPHDYDNSNKTQQQPSAIVPPPPEAQAQFIPATTEPEIHLGGAAGTEPPTVTAIPVGDPYYYSTTPNNNPQHATTTATTY